MHIEELLRARIEGLHILVSDGPRWRYAAVVTEFAEVFRAETEHRCAIDFSLAAHEIGLLRVQVLAFLIDPDVLRVIAVFEENIGGVPVGFFLGEKRPAFQDEYLFSCTCEL